MAANPEPSFTLGIEEEYLLVDPVTRDLMVEPPASLLEACEKRAEGHISPEFMKCQIEVGTPVCKTIQEAREELAFLRTAVSEEARNHDLAIIAAATHPFATWRPQKTTGRQRYDQLARDIGVPARRLLICAMHVHVGIEDENLRIDLMNQARYFLPHLLALSTSSPFWQGQDTGLKSYRLAVFNELPRTGIPEDYRGFGEYEQHVNALVQAGAIEDGTKLWWDIRPSARFPTLEMRISDICTRLDDGVTIAALYLSILRMLWRLKRMNVTWRRYKTLLINENRWRAMRYGLDSGLIDFGRGELVPYAELLEEILALVREDAEALGCWPEVERARRILSRRTSADSQLRLYNEARQSGAGSQEACARVVDWLIEETMAGL
ncbi:carboxylate-amine ligase [Inquilinus sp. CAU 1745]|uniref:carboxylate-amine ligase n=1 Tax=Inquilinus sp. CAU 1745 TaxID=3140369 RepID=UPI00325A602F